MSNLKLVELYLYDTCSLACGYCTLAESGMVLDRSQLDKLRDRSTVDQIVSFFQKHRQQKTNWHFILTGGEPLLMPTFEYFCDKVLEAGDRVSMYSNLSPPLSHSRFKFLLDHQYPQFDYIMASFHPEAKADTDAFFLKVGALKSAGHRVIVRFVGHPSRLEEIDDLATQCIAHDVTLYTTALFSDNYPASYTDQERLTLKRSFVSFSQRIQLEGGLDVSTRKCLAGSRLFCVNLQTGNITPCITVSKPILGNIYSDTFRPAKAPISCPEERQVCSCDTHFQQGIVDGADDGNRFSEIASRHVTPMPLLEQDLTCKENELSFANAVLRQGNVQDDTRLYFTPRELRERYRVTKGRSKLLELWHLVKSFARRRFGK